MISDYHLYDASIAVYYSVCDFWRLFLYSHLYLNNQRQLMQFQIHHITITITLFIWSGYCRRHIFTPNNAGISCYIKSIHCIPVKVTTLHHNWMGIFRLSITFERYVILRIFIASADHMLGKQMNPKTVRTFDKTITKRKREGRTNGKTDAVIVHSTPINHTRFQQAINEKNGKANVINYVMTNCSICWNCCHPD